MPLKIKSSDWVRILRVFSRRVRTREQLRLLLGMLAWSVWLRALRPFLPLKRLVRWAVPTGSGGHTHPADVLRYLGWLGSIGLLPRTRTCLVRSLVVHRYLTLAGSKPALWIGFDGSRGHAWVEVAGEAVLEPEQALRRYRRALVVPPGSRMLVKAAH